MSSSAQVETAPSTSMAVPPPPPPPPAVTKKNQQPLPAPSSGSNRQSPPTAGRQRSSSLSSAPSSVSPTSSSASVPTKSISSSSLSSGNETSSLPPLVPHYTKPAILGLPPSAVLTKQEMDFRANLLNPNNDLFWTARGLIRPPVLADALAQGHAILKHEGHLTQKQGGRRLSAQYGRSGGNGPSASLTSSAPSVGATSLPLGFGAAVVSPTSVAAAVQGSWRSAAPTPAPPPPLPSHVTKEEMDFRANRLNPNNDVFWTSRGLIRPPVLADALAQGHAILQHEGHLTQTQSHKGRGRLNSLPQSSLYASADGRASAEPRRSVSGQGLPGSSTGGRSSSWRSTERERESQPMAMRRRASTTGSMMNRPPALDGSVTKEEVDLRANLMNPNNSIFWTSRGLTRPADLQEALAKGHAVLEAEGHVTHNSGGGSGGAAGGGRSRSWNRRGSRTELHGPPAVSPLVAAAQRQWSTPFLAPNAGAGPLAPPSTLTARSGGLPGAAWVHASGGSGPVPSTRHPDWQANSNNNAQRRRYSLPPPGFELFTPPAHFGLFRPPLQQAGAKQAAATALPLVREGAADGEWDKMDAEAAAAAATRPPHSAAIPIIKPTAADLAKSKGETWARKAAAETKPSADDEAKAMKQEDKKTTTATTTSSTAAASGSSKLTTSSGSSPTRIAGLSPSEPTTPASEKPASPSIDKVGSLAWQLTQVKLRTRRPSEARESEHVTKSATA